MADRRNSKSSSRAPTRITSKYPRGHVSEMLGDAHFMWEKPQRRPEQSKHTESQLRKPLVGRGSEGWVPPVGSAADLPDDLGNLLRGAGGTAIDGIQQESAKPDSDK